MCACGLCMNVCVHACACECVHVCVPVPPGIHVPHTLPRLCAGPASLSLLLRACGRRVCRGCGAFLTAACGALCLTTPFSDAGPACVVHSCADALVTPDTRWSVRQVSSSLSWCLRPTGRDVQGRCSRSGAASAARHAPVHPLWAAVGGRRLPQERGARACRYQACPGAWSLQPEWSFGHFPAQRSSG